jgi:hypothetical protein
MQFDELYPLKDFVLTQIIKTSSGKVLLKATSSSRSAVCPYCQTLSEKRHSSYIRKPQALPCSNTPVQLVLSVQRYICQNPECSHTTFAERIPDTSSFYSRKTVHLEVLLKVLAFEMSAETVARVCYKLNLQVSPDSVLRTIRKLDTHQKPYVRVLGVDDWAFRKGQNYGTLLVDLERHKAIDLLSDRTQQTLCAWLLTHPEIEIISRDRSFEYKAGIEKGAPQALQVVDRWHLLHNLREKLQEIIPAQLKRPKTDQKKKETPSYQKRRKYFELVHYLGGCTGLEIPETISESLRCLSGLPAFALGWGMPGCNAALERIAAKRIHRTEKKRGRVFTAFSPTFSISIHQSTGLVVHEGWRGITARRKKPPEFFIDRQPKTAGDLPVDAILSEIA